MNLIRNHKSPFEVIIAFHKVIENLEKIVHENKDEFQVSYAKSLILSASKYPELKTGFSTAESLDKNQNGIRMILADLFPSSLTHNEIKAATVPFTNVIFNKTKRLEKIIDNAGIDFDLYIRNFTEHQQYVMSCCLILNFYFNQDNDFMTPIFYDIPDEKGIMNQYRILYNADFIDIIPTDKAKMLTENDIKILLNNYDNFDLWLEMFPPKSWILKGFGLVVLYNATMENAISNLKSNLIANNPKDPNYNENLVKSFHAIFKTPDLQLGFMPYQEGNQTLGNAKIKTLVNSFLLDNHSEKHCKDILCNSVFKKIFESKNYFVVSNVQDLINSKDYTLMAQKLLDNNIQSYILAPVVKNDKVLGLIEIASNTAYALNTINALKIDLIMPFVVDTIDRYLAENENEIDALIQKEFTTIHQSVYWKFKESAQTILFENEKGVVNSVPDIVFQDVYPLYGQIDVIGSSNARNLNTQLDLMEQISFLIDIFETCQDKNLLVFEQRKFELEELLTLTKENIQSDTEFKIQSFIESEIHPVLKQLKVTQEGRKKTEEYLKIIDNKTNLFYKNRKKFDNSLTFLNEKFSALLDEKQNEAQAIFPHYYERFKTDGVEHNLYIGKSIAPSHGFDLMYLKNLRLWQLQVMCEKVLLHKKLKSSLEYPLEVSSLILAFNAPLNIRFRMDEKRFDVDGSYNARYEVIKKRIDKAKIKNSEERITQSGKITIVISNKIEENEYEKFIKYLEHKKIIKQDFEIFEIEDLQGVIGLKGIRIEVIEAN